MFEWNEQKERIITILSKRHINAYSQRDIRRNEYVTILLISGLGIALALYGRIAGGMALNREMSYEATTAYTRNTQPRADDGIH